MASKEICCKCQKLPWKIPCIGCNQNFCTKCHAKHQDDMKLEIENQITERDLIQDKLSQAFKEKYTEDTLRAYIDKWEKDMIKRLKAVAHKAREQLENILEKIENDMMAKFQILTDALVTFRENKNYLETDIAATQKQIEKFHEDLNRLNQPNETVIIFDKSAILKWDDLLHVYERHELQTKVPTIPINMKWSKNGTTVLNCLNYPQSMSVDQVNGTVFVADTGNGRIISWKPNTNEISIVVSNLRNPRSVFIDQKTNSLVIAETGKSRILRWSLVDGTKKGETIIKNIDCSSIVMDSDGNIYTNDMNKHEIRKFGREDKTGTIAAGANGYGRALNQVYGDSKIAVDHEGSIYISDSSNHRIVKWKPGAQEGILVAGINVPGPGLNQLNTPRSVLVDTNAFLYVVEQGNHRVTRWKAGGKAGMIVLGGNGVGNKEDQFNNPLSLALDKDNNLYVLDCSNNRLQRFSVE